MKHVRVKDKQAGSALGHISWIFFSNPASSRKQPRARKLTAQSITTHTHPHPKNSESGSPAADSHNWGRVSARAPPSRTPPAEPRSDPHKFLGSTRAPRSSPNTHASSDKIFYFPSKPGIKKMNLQGSRDEKETPEPVRIVLVESGFRLLMYGSPGIN